MLMTYFKSVLAGLAAVLVIFGILPMLMTFFYFLVVVPLHGEHESETNFYLVHWRVPTVAVWLFALSVFAIGFVWEFLRLRKHDVPSLPTS